MSSAVRAILTKGQQPLQSFIQRSSVSTGTCQKTVKTVASEPFNVLKDGMNHKVSNLEKRFLVWAGKFPRIQDVPPTVPQGMMEKARNKIRIKVSNYMMLATVVASVAFVYSGKQAAKRGESVQKMNLDWHRQINGESSKPDV
ncbi:UPF0389 protein CG9231 [Anabrus simplex]|uniref:UPF0389 protein CG9231 n=1 Tax=Anabrus simplex TaxID=316456 RepID=UPI0034DD0937